MLRISQRRRLLRQASALPPDLIAQLPEAELALYLRMKERLEEKRRQGSEWIGVVVADAVNNHHPKKFMVDSKLIHGGSSINPSTMDARSLESAVTEDLTLCSSSSNMTGCEEPIGSFMAKGETTANAAWGVSFEEYSCSSCSYACFCEQCDHHHQPRRLDCNEQHADNSTTQSGDGSSNSIFVGEDCGCVSASSSFKQEETEIIFDSELYKNLKSNYMLFATPFLREQHMKVLRSKESLYDQAACSVQSLECDRDDTFSYSGFFLEEIENVDVKQIKSISSKVKTSASHRQPHPASTQKNEAAPLKKTSTPNAIKDNEPILACADSDFDEETFYTACYPAANDYDNLLNSCVFDAPEKREAADNSADDCSYSAFFLEEVVPPPTKRVNKIQSFRTSQPDNMLASDAKRKEKTDFTMEAGMAPSCEDAEDISFRKFRLDQGDPWSPKPNCDQDPCNSHDDGSKTTETAIGEGQDMSKECSKAVLTHEMTLGRSNGNILGDKSSSLRHTKRKSTTEKNAMIIIVVVPVLDNSYDGVNESSSCDVSLTSWPAADEIYIGEVDETLLEGGRSDLAKDHSPEVQTAHDPSDRHVETLLEKFDGLYASWLADRRCSRSLVPGDEKGDDEPVCLGYLDVASASDLCQSPDVENDFVEQFPDNEPKPQAPVSQKVPALLSHTTLGSLRKAKCLYDDVVASESIDQELSIQGGNDALIEEPKGATSEKNFGHENRSCENKSGKFAHHCVFPDAELDVKKNQNSNETLSTTRLQVATETSLSSMPNTTPVPTMTYETKWAISEDDYNPGNIRDGKIHLHRHEFSQFQLHFKFR